MIQTSNARNKRKRLQRLAVLSAAVAASALASAGAHAASTCQPWSSATAYSGGDTVTEGGKTYKANWWTRGNDPLTSHGDTGTGQPWTATSSCGVTAAAPVAATPAAPPAATPVAASVATPTASGTCAAWLASTAYAGGATVSAGGKTYKANWWTQGNDPVTSSGPIGTGQPWTLTSACGTSNTTTTTTTATATATAAAATAATATAATTAASAAAKATAAAAASTTKATSTTTTTSTQTPTTAGFIFGSYKDVTVNMDWNVDQISTVVPGARTQVLAAIPAKQTSATWAFASGECGAESWGGVTPASLVGQNVSQWVGANKKYIISTGGASGVFIRGSDSGFEKFIQTYDSASLQGFDFDIEGGQSQEVINALVARVKVGQVNHPGLRFSFTIASLGGNAPQSLGQIGVSVMNAIKTAGLTKYVINLMAMDYGTALATNCTLGSSGKCDMGQSAINAALNLHTYWNLPYSQIELTPMIGGNDATDETYTLANVDALAAWTKANGLAGIHFWSMDRDTDCAGGSASATCNSYGSAGNFGFTNRFITDLGL